MGINFDIIKWPARPATEFPIAFQDAPTESAPVPWAIVREYLFSLGARENGGADSLWFDLENNSSLQIWGVRMKEGRESTYVSITFKVHAYWTHVLSIYRKALEFDPQLVLFDPQEGVFHTDVTFEPLATAQREYIRKNLGA